MGRKRKLVRRRLAPTTVEAAVSYIDTVVLRLPQLLASDFFEALQASLKADGHCGSTYLRRIVRPDGMWWFALFLHQPKTSALQLLASVQPQCWITEVHVSLDLLTDDARQAEALQTYVENRMVKSKRRVQASDEVLGTTYIDRNLRRGVEVAIYSDRASKFADGHPCMHIDWRVRGSVALDKAKLRTPEALLAVNYRAFWAERLRLEQAPSRSELRIARLKEIASRGDVLKLTQQVDQLLDRLARLTSGRDGSPRTNDLLLFLSEYPGVFGRRARRLFSRQPTTWMLPTHTSALW